MASSSLRVSSPKLAAAPGLEETPIARLSLRGKKSLVVSEAAAPAGSAEERGAQDAGRERRAGEGVCE